MFRHLTTILLATCAGCAPYVAVQSRLVEQTQRGVGALEQSLEQKSQIVAKYHSIQRQRLDDAFDADVRNRPQLDPDWVIDHRRAYATALDALAASQFQSTRAAEVDARNAAAVRDALETLRRLQSAQLGLVSFGRESDRGND